MTDDEIADFMGDAAEPATTRPAKRATIDAPIWERFSGWGRTYDELGA